mgnify:CR=1 FL=1
MPLKNSSSFTFGLDYFLHDQLFPTDHQTLQHDEDLLVAGEGRQVVDVHMDVDEAGYRCPVCLGPFDNENPISLYQCGHNLHTSCLRTLLGQGTQCPICRQTPGITPEQINCTVCQMVMASDDSSEDQTVIVARKCGHFHLRGCQRDYLAGLTQEFPFSNQALEVLNNSNLPGCLTCVGAARHCLLC